MDIERINISQLRIDEAYTLSFPADPRQRAARLLQWVHLPLMIINPQNLLVFGIDFYRFFLSRGVEEIDVIRLDIPKKEALFLNINLQGALFGLNLYEKLVFIKNISPHAEKEEIYRRTELGININRELTDKLNLLAGETFRDILVQEKIHLKTALRIGDFEREDREPFIHLFMEVPFSASRALKIMEMAEEICFRDKSVVEGLFERLKIGDHMGRESPQGGIIETLFRDRYPLYSEEKRRWEAELEQLHLPPHLEVSHVPFFEKKQVQLTATFEDMEALKKFFRRPKG